MKLIIVESPTKAKTLGRFLGDAYVVEATMGHVKDLPKSKLGVDVKNNFEPLYEPVQKRADTIGKIKKAAKKADKIFLATDPDREGEAIAQHVQEILQESITGSKGTTSKIPRDTSGTPNTRDTRISRIAFHEITKEAVEKAIKSPREVDKHLVDAQIARRVLDRLVGYKLSPLLWKKVRIGLSAGRVQTVALRLIVEREREIKAFKPVEYWEVFCQVSQARDTFTVQLIKIGNRLAEIRNKEEVEEIVSALGKAEFRVADVKRREISKNPYAPFTTSTMSQAGATLFGWSAKRTMSIAQALYEQGAITYHRTDSTNIAGAAVSKTRDYIRAEFGQNYLPEGPRIYKTKAKVAQEAHEAIRPTDVSNQPTTINQQPDAKRLYELIWRRFVACQMVAAVYDETTIDVLAGDYLLRASGQTMKFDGWRKVIPAKVAGDETVQLPAVVQGENLRLMEVNPLQKFTQPPARFNEASLIKTLEELGIGRPSTYAPIISTILIRNYVEKSQGKFIPTPVGEAVNDFLLKNFPDIFEYSFTAGMENSLDNIAKGDVEWEKTIGDFWKPFEPKLKKVEKTSERVKIATEKLNRKCPQCKEGELVVRIGRFGKFISCSRFPDCKYTEKFIEKVGMKCPECNQGEVIVKRSRKGRNFFGCSRYPECKWASWRKPQLPAASSEQNREEAKSTLDIL